MWKRPEPRAAPRSLERHRRATRTRSLLVGGIPVAEKERLSVCKISKWFTATSHWGGRGVMHPNGGRNLLGVKWNRKYVWIFTLQELHPSIFRTGSSCRVGVRLAGLLGPPQPRQGTTWTKSVTSRDKTTVCAHTDSLSFRKVGGRQRPPQRRRFPEARRSTLLDPCVAVSSLSLIPRNI